MASKAQMPNSQRNYDLEVDGITITAHTPPKRLGADARDVANWTRNGGKSKDDAFMIEDDEEVQDIYPTSSDWLSRPGTSWQTATNPKMTNATLGPATFQTTDSNPQVWSNPSTGPSTRAGTHNNSTKPVPRISSGSGRAFSSSLPRQTSAAPNGSFLTDSAGLPRKRKNTEPPNLSATVSKKQRVDLIDVNQLDGFKGFSLQRPTTPHSFSNGNMIYQSNVQLEHPPNVGRGSGRTDLEPLPRAAPTPSSNIPAKQQIRSTSIALAPQAPMPDSHLPNQSPTRPQPGHRITGGNSLSSPIMKEAPRGTPRRQSRPFWPDPQSNTPRPPKTTPKTIPKTGNLPNNVINLCSSDDEGPMDSDLSDGARYSQTEAQGLENVGPRTGGESDSDYWSICLSDDDRDEPSQALDLVGKVQQTPIQKRWIPPTSTENHRLRKPFGFAPAYHFLHKQTSFFHTTLDLRTTLATGRIRAPRQKERFLGTFLSPLRSDMIHKCAELTMGMGINYVTQSEHRVFVATVPGRQASPALNVYDTIAKLTVPVEPDQEFMHPMHEIGVDPANPLRVLTTEYADWAEMDPNQADQKCVRIWDWLEVEDSDVGEFIEADSWEYDGRPMGIAFNPDRSTWRQEDDELSMCAIGCGSGQLMIHYSRKSRDRIHVVDPAHKQHVSSLVWGNGPTSNTLFAGTMEDKVCGVSGHIAVVSLRTDLVTVMDRIQNIGEVDALGISPQGDRLAACIRGQGLPSLEIYALDHSGIQNSSKVSTRSTRHPSFDSSVSSSSSSAQARISLEAFDTQQVEVSFCKWSPCGAYIAVGRNDDRVDLFDSRFIKYGPVSRMVHGEPIKRTPWKALWGITGLEWVEGAGRGQQALASGGTDGCVRLWDIRHADPVCDILAEMEADVGSFSVGDIGKREAPLVVADSEGMVVVLSDIGAAKKAGYANW